MEADKSNICNRQAGDPGEPAYRISSSLNPRLKAEDVGQRERIPPSSACCVLFRSTAHLGEDNLLNSVYHSTVHLIQKHANRHTQKQYSPRYLGVLCPSQHDIKLTTALGNSTVSILLFGCLCPGSSYPGGWGQKHLSWHCSTGQSRTASGCAVGTQTWVNLGSMVSLGSITLQHYSMLPIEVGSILKFQNYYISVYSFPTSAFPY